MLNLYLISQSVNNDYDTYDSAVVAAASEEEARLIYPDNWGTNKNTWNGSRWLWHLEDGRVLDAFSSSWTSPDNVSVQFLAAGYEGPAGTVLASFNAG
jgi:hypothetical protein